MSYFKPVLECKSIVSKDLYKLDAKDLRSNMWNRSIVAIVTCLSNKNRFKNFMRIYQNIFNRFGLKYYIILASPNIDTEYMIKNRLFIAKSKEAYENLAHKISIFYSYVYNETNYDYIIKVDDGCLLDFSKIILNPEADYMGSVIRPTLNTVHFNKCTDKKYNSIKLDFKHDLDEFCSSPEQIKQLYDIKFAGGGYGYRLSRNAFQHIDKYKTHILSLNLSYEDVLFGQIMFLEGIELVGCGIGRYHYISNI